MNRNPLTTIVIVLALGDAFTLKDAITNGTVDAFNIYSWLQMLVLLLLYFTKSRFAASFLFYTCLPIFPVYFGLKAAGLNPPPASGAVYGITFIIYAMAIALLWKLKRDYDQFLLMEMKPEPREG